MYIDTSSFLKFLLPSSEAKAVATAILAENEIVVSPLVDLETRIQLRARRRAGLLRRGVYARLLARVDAIDQEFPFFVRRLPRTLFRTALRQHRDSEEVHLRTLDRLHLAAMEELKITRLMTHDIRQADAARELGYEVLLPV